jgi:transposase-like protein
MEALEAVLASLGFSDSVNYAQTAREYGVDPTTLRRRHKSKQVSRHQAAFESKSLLTEAHNPYNMDEKGFLIGLLNSRLLALFNCR